MALIIKNYYVNDWVVGNELDIYLKIADTADKSYTKTLTITILKGQSIAQFISELTGIINDIITIRY